MVDQLAAKRMRLGCTCLRMTVNFYWSEKQSCSLTSTIFTRPAHFLPVMTYSVCVIEEIQLAKAHRDAAVWNGWVLEMKCVLYFTDSGQQWSVRGAVQARNPS